MLKNDCDKFTDLIGKAPESEKVECRVLFMRNTNRTRETLPEYKLIINELELIDRSGCFKLLRKKGMKTVRSE